MDNRSKYVHPIIRMCDEWGEFISLDYGRIYWWPSSSVRGALLALELRAMADELDARNARGEKNLEILGTLP